jgi:predicted Rossmann fold flavoprotein
MEVFLDAWDVIVIGAGAAGLMCAITAGKRGRRVLILETSNRPGKKILMSGGGRCNFTNLYMDADKFLSNNSKFCKSALNRYTKNDFIELVKKYDINYHEKAFGQLFCDNSSKDILNMLLAEAKKSQVTIKTNCTIKEYEHKEQFIIKTCNDKFKAKSLAIATGGLSVPTLGGTDFGYKIAKMFGHKITSLRPALVPFVFTDKFKLMSEKLSGISLYVRLSLNKYEFYENILFTHRGLSGPAVLQISSYWKEGDEIEINLMPSMDCMKLLLEQKQKQPKILLRSILYPFLPKKLVLEIQNLWWPERKETPIAELPDLLLKELADKIHNWKLRPSGTEGYRTAEVTLGGVDTSDISSKTMESKIKKDLYFIGEVLDVTGHLGGFNFQWAWASGYVAGKVI